MKDILRDENSGVCAIILHGQGRHDFKLTATRMNVVGQGDCIVIPLQEGALYFTREQAMEVFDLMEKPVSLTVSWVDKKWMETK